jgi:hypothetical protein
MAANIPDAELVVFENSAHMTYVEEDGLGLLRSSRWARWIGLWRRC